MKFFLVLLFPIYLFSKQYIVGFSQDTLSNDWRLAQVKQVKHEINKYSNFKLYVKDANAKVSKQIRDIEEFINQGVDFIIASPKDAQITSLVLKKAIAKGIKVILISRTINSDDYTVFIAPDNYKIGQDAAKLLVKKLNKKGTILMLQGIQGASSTTQRKNGFLDIVKKYPNINVVLRRGNYLRNDAIKVMEGIYQDKINFDAIYSHSDSMLIGAREVMNRLQKNTKIPMVGIDYIQETKTAIQEGSQMASFVYPTSAKEGVQAIVDIINGKKVAKNIIVESIMVTKENANKIEPIF